MEIRERSVLDGNLLLNRLVQLAKVSAVLGLLPRLLSLHLILELLAQVTHRVLGLSARDRSFAHRLQDRATDGAQVL